MSEERQGQAAGKEAVAQGVGQAPPLPPPAAGGDPQRPACPLVPLGQGRDGVYYFLGPLGELRVMSFRDLNRAGIASLTGGETDWLRGQFPVFDKNGEPTGSWSHDAARDALIRMCAAKGLFNPREVIRGPGAWLDRDERLVVHAGPEVLIDGRWWPAGRVLGGLIYPACPPETRPADEAATAEEATAAFAHLERWNWRSPREAPRLLFGFVVQSYIAGALDWRAHVWVAGDRGTGKTLLHRFVKRLLGSVIISSANSTEAGVRQILNQDSSARAVELDEMEHEPGSSRLADVVRLCRIAASGALTHRGSAGGVAQAFRLDCCVLLSSIFYPRFLPQDAGRICVLELDRLEADQEDRRVAVEGVKRLGALGPRLYRRVVDGWERLQANLETFRLELSNAGRTTRVADQFGTLLACAETALRDEAVPPHEARALLASLDVDAVMNLHPEESWELALQHLFTKDVDVREAGTQRRFRVGEIVADALHTAGDPARDDLKRLGLKLVMPVAADGATRWLAWDGEGEVAWVWLAVANHHQALEQAFAGTPWERGVWAQALLTVPPKAVAGAGGTEAMLPGACRSGRPIAFGDVVRSRAVCVPAHAFRANERDEG